MFMGGCTAHLLHWAMFSVGIFCVVYLICWRLSSHFLFFSFVFLVLNNQCQWVLCCGWWLSITMTLIDKAVMLKNTTNMCLDCCVTLQWHNYKLLGWGTMVQAGRSRVGVPMRWIFFNLPNPSSYTVALGFTQPLIEMSTRNLPGVNERPVRKADNLTAICEPTV
jgi:hypothetical protein